MKRLFKISSIALLTAITLSSSSSFAFNLSTDYSFSLSSEDSTRAVYYTVANERDTTFYVNKRQSGWLPFGTYIAAETTLREVNPGLVLLPGTKPMSALFDVSSVGNINSVAKSANGLVLDGTSLVAQTADENFPGMLNIGAQSIAGAKTFTTSVNTPSLTAGTGTITGNINVGGKLGVNYSPTGLGDINTGANGIYSWRSANRFIRFNSSGTFNDFQSKGAKLAINFGFDGVPEDITVFEATQFTGNKGGRFSIGTGDISARLVVQGLTNNSSDFSLRTFNSDNQVTFGLRNDGRVLLPISPVVSTSDYDLLTRNTISGEIEKVTFSDLQNSISSSNTGGSFVQNQSGVAQPATFNISGAGRMGSGDIVGKLAVAAPAGSDGDINTGSAGVYSWRDANRYIRFNTSGTANDFLSFGAKLAFNFGFGYTPSDITMFEFTKNSGNQGGHLAIGTGETSARLVVRGVTNNSGNYTFRALNSNDSTTFAVRNDGLTEISGPGIRLKSGNNYGLFSHTNTGNRSWHLPDSSGTIAMTSNLSGSTGYMSKFTGSNTIGNSAIFESSGNIGIGTTNTHGYKLAINGSVIAESVKIKLNGEWPDYVFEAGYKNVSLGDIEKFIKVNKHLPGIPSKEEVSREGVDLGDMNAKLLEKIEELTLHLIEKEKQLNEISIRMNKLEEHMLKR